MEPYLWRTRPDGINVINVGKTWYGNGRNFHQTFQVNDWLLMLSLGALVWRIGKSSCWLPA
jgi:hypothetical protein